MRSNSIPRSHPLAAVVLLTALVMDACTGSNESPHPPTPTPVSIVGTTCDRKEVALVPSSPPPGARTLAQIEQKVGGNLKGPPTVAMFGKVTIGVTVGRAPQPGDLQRDTSGALIADRPAWVLVYDHQHIPNPAGHKIVRPPVTSAPERYFTEFGDVVDSRTGESVYGWNCASQPEFPHVTRSP